MITNLERPEFCDELLRALCWRLLSASFACFAAMYAVGSNLGFLPDLFDPIEPVLFSDAFEPTDDATDRTEFAGDESRLRR